MKIRMFFGALIALWGLASQPAFARLDHECSELLAGQPDLMSLLNGMKSDARSKIDLIEDQQYLDATQLGPDGQAILEKMDQLMIGHRDVKEALARAVQRAAIGAKDAGRPVATMLLLGITGTGKSLTAQALAQALTGDPNGKITITCGEMQQDHEISKITGSPPGYIGHSSTAPLITEARLKEITNPEYNVNVLEVDELEKASPALQRLLLGILEKGEMTTGDNKRIDMSHTIVIMTSNLGQQEMQRILSNDGFSLGFAPPSTKAGQVKDEELDEAARAAVALQLAPEFRNRIDRTFVFKQHTPEESKEILDMAIASVQRKNFLVEKEHPLVFQVTDEARQFILENEYRPEFGGRSLRRTVDQLIAEPLSNMIAAKNLQKGDVVRIGLDATGKKLSFQKVASALSVQEMVDLYHKLYAKNGMQVVIDQRKSPQPQRMLPPPPWDPNTPDPFGDDFID
jgi:ATP-dependent Clp protease ATP-binding subunit ClpA